MKTPSNTTRDPAQYLLRFPAGVRGKVFTRAMLAAADHLGMTDNEVVAATGIAHSQLFRMRNNKDSLSPHSPLWDKAWLLIRLQQEVSEYCHRDRDAMRWWLHRPCRSLRCVPAQRLKRPGGLEWIIESLEQLKAAQVSLGDLSGSQRDTDSEPGSGGEPPEPKP